jgi:tRNA(Ile)-lysidine synthase
MKSSAPSVITIARRALAGDAKLVRGSALLVAVSGGADSMTLLHVLARLAPSFALTLHAHGVDHGLRADAKRELDGAADFAKSLGVPFARTVVDVARGGNVQARARTARHAALAHAAAQVGARAIATAHHADDRAETVLMRLMRGAGPRGLAVLPPRDAAEAAPELELVRPLLRARRAAIRAHAARHRIPFADDPSNEDPRFLRARVRREVMPLLESVAPGIVDHLTALADQLALERASEPRGSAQFPWSLPRATQVALADLARSRSTSARVWLPHGLVVTVDAKARSARAGEK